MLVIDASVAIKWYLDEPLADAALRLAVAEPDPIAPDLIVAEVGNALWRRRRQGDISAAQVTAAASALPHAFSELVAAAELISDALRIAEQLDHPIYDCLYLALAWRRESVVVTADRRLAARVHGTEWDLRVRLLAGRAGQS